MNGEFSALRGERKMDRREFVHGAAGAASGLLLLKPAAALAYPANSAVRLGLLGCGNRGTHVAESFSQSTAAQVVALADIFPDQLEAAHAHFSALNAGLGRAPVEGTLLFRGPHAFEQLASSPGVDLIQISTPPFFHVQHLQAAVGAGKHVYCEKPLGIDVAQARQALAIAKQVQPTQSVDVGFQCRSAPPFAAISEKIRAGTLGKIASITANYFAPASLEKVVPGASADEHRLRNWLWDRALSGDILVEQNIHIVDLANWMLNAHPLKATATGGRTILTHAGDCWDNYQVDFTYPGEIRLSFSSTQFGSYGLFEAGLRLFGSDGAATVPYAGPVQIVGAQPWTWQDSADASPGQSRIDQGKTVQGKFAANGAFADNLAFADREKERAFIDSIVSGPAHNQIADGVASALSCMLGRMAGYQHREVTWEELLAHGETYRLDMNLDQFA
jgi:myo-inositol 2-dehydrogenase / D-chiro-inositol 1-dehydrogenase